MFLALKLGQSAEAGHRHIPHDLADDGFPLVGQFNVLHAGAGDLGHRLNAFDVLGPDLSHAAAVGIVNAAGAAGADGNKLRLGRSGPRQYENGAQYHNAGQENFKI